MTNQATPNSAIGYFVSCSMRSTRWWRPPDGFLPAITWRRFSSLRSFSSRRSCSSLSRRWIRSREDGFFFAVLLPGTGWSYRWSPPQRDEIRRWAARRPECPPGSLWQPHLIRVLRDLFVQGGQHLVEMPALDDALSEGGVVGLGEVPALDERHAKGLFPCLLEGRTIRTHRPLASGPGLRSGARRGCPPAREQRGTR